MPVRFRPGRKRKLRVGSRWAAARSRMRAARMGGRVPSVYRFKEWYSPGTITVPATTGQGYVLTSQLNALNNIAHYVGLYDLYKITGMKVTFVPQHNVSDFGQGIASAIPMLYVATNRDPYVPAPVSVADILNDDGVKIIRFTKPVSFYVKNPKAQIVDSEGQQIPLQFNSSSKALQPWLTTGGNSQTINQSNLLHYGLRYFVDNTGMTTPVQVAFQVFVKLYVSFKEQD